MDAGNAARRLRTRQQSTSLPRLSGHLRPEVAGRPLTTVEPEGGGKESSGNRTYTSKYSRRIYCTILLILNERQASLAVFDNRDSYLSNAIVVCK